MPADEAERLADLRMLRLLDTRPEAEYDALTRLAAKVLGTEIALVSLVDADRQWFKASVGLAAQETSRDISFCGHAVAQNAMLVVPDARDDVRFAQNPLVVGSPGIRFYAGAPIYLAPDRPLGTLCVIDSRPRIPAPDDLEALRLLADQVSALFRARRANLALIRERAELAVYRRYFELTPELLLTTDRNLTIERLNPAWERMLGHTPSALVGTSLRLLLPKDDAERLDVALEGLQAPDGLDGLDGKAGTARLDVAMRRGDGRLRTLAVTAVLASDGYYMAARDVTQQHADRATLAEREARLRALLDSLAEGVVVRDLQGRMLDCNAAASELFGLTRDELLAEKPPEPGWRMLDEGGAPFPQDAMPSRVALRTGKAVTDTSMCIESPQGGRTWLRINARPIRLPGVATPAAVLSTFRDVTQERRAHELAERVSRQERLLTTGTLAAGVGHEINNPLSYIIGNLDLILDEMQARTAESMVAHMGSCRTLLDEAREGAERIRRIVRGLRALAQPGHPDAVTDLRHVIDQSLGTMAPMLRKRATVEIDVPPLPPVLGDEPRLTQALVNLLMNAVQAFDGGTEATNLIRLSARRTAEGVELDIADTGRGVPKALSGRIFDPFFTTRPVGQGLGLGLSIAHNIVADLGGALVLVSQETPGATFRLRLPLAEIEAVVPGAAQDAMRRVLLVDDDPALLSALEFMLEADYHVVATADPREAVKLLARSAFDAVLTDLGMPHLTGTELHALVKSRDPEQAARFVFISGDPTALAAALAESVEGRNGPAGLAKPLHASEVRACIESLARKGRYLGAAGTGPFGQGPALAGVQAT